MFSITIKLIIINKNKLEIVWCSEILVIIAFHIVLYKASLMKFMINVWGDAFIRMLAPSFVANLQVTAW